ncbi:MAG: SDR family oxidoreductase [Bacteroidetes bacterium]|nr:SDR family oxidoreductase [Bacteroidota bacterium]
MKLRDKKILLTGGSSGIGKATAIDLIQAGAQVVITGRDEEKLMQTAKEIGAIPLAFDVSEYETIPEKVAEAVAKLGGLDVLMNNAGIGNFDLLDNLTIHQFENIYSVNVFGLALLTQEVVKYFKAKDRGDIVNIASMAATKGFSHGTVYASSKFALRGMTQCWQQELRKHNIRVMLINPSEVPTAFNQEDRTERDDIEGKLTAKEIAHTIRFALEMDDRGFIPELSVWATNPFTG